MTTYRCPKGHSSETDDFCDTCGAKIAGDTTPAAPAAGQDQAVRQHDCPNCGAPRAGASRFCEDCGYDHDTGRVPVITAVTAPAGAWTATIAVDRKYFEENAIEGVEFPLDTPERTVELPGPQLRIGRKSSSKGTHPEIDLSRTDPGVSHSHALLTLSVDGVWLVSDLGSTNGTYLNDEQKPISAGQSRPLTDGDQVHVGAWTTITLHAPF
jgi:FHA domain